MSPTLRHAMIRIGMYSDHCDGYRPLFMQMMGYTIPGDLSQVTKLILQPKTEFLIEL